MTISPETFSADIASIMDDAHIPGLAVGVVQDASVAFSQGFGECNVEQHPVHPHTLFPIASCTKSFTTYALAHLAEKDQFDWDAPVQKYLPTFMVSTPTLSSQITGRDIACHRTGIGDHPEVWITSTLSRAEFIRDVLPTLPFSAPFRQKHVYSNAMYTILGEIIHTISGQSWECFIEENILNHYALSHTGFLDEHWWDRSERASPFELNEQNKRKPAKRFFTTTHHLIGPASEMYSCVYDMTTWITLQMQMAHSTPSSPGADLYQPLIPIPKQENRHYGLGWRIEQKPGFHIIYHSGHCTGYTSLQAFCPQKKTGIILLANLHNALSSLEQITKFVI